MIRALLLSLSLLPSLSTLAQAQSPARDAPPVRRGDRWVFDQRDEILGEKRNTYAMVVTEVTDKEIVTRVTARGATRSKLIAYSLDWDEVDNGAWKYQPHDGLGVRRPLAVGAEWRFENDASNLDSGVEIRGAGVSKVVARERIATRLGTLDAFKIESVVREVNTRDQSRGSETKIVTWYAPSVNHWVRRETEVRSSGRLRSHFSEEVFEYTRRP